MTTGLIREAEPDMQDVAEKIRRRETLEAKHIDVLWAERRKIARRRNDAARARLKGAVEAQEWV
jgi:multidrug resistance efflux pump